MRKLLLADDSITTQKVVKLTFADEGVEVVSAEDGDTALQLASQIQPDIVLADVNMPGLNGYEVCEIIKKRESSRNTPVILLVGSFEPFDLEEARRVGASDYLTKPFSSIRKLVDTVFGFLPSETDRDESASAETDASLGTDGAAESPTSDIEELYNRSLESAAGFEVDIESQSTVAEAAEAQSAVPVPPVAEATEISPEPTRGGFGDPAFDDELIDSTVFSDDDLRPELDDTIELPRVGDLTGQAEVNGEIGEADLDDGDQGTEEVKSEIVTSSSEDQQYERVDQTHEVVAFDSEHAGSKRDAGVQDDVGPPMPWDSIAFEPEPSQGFDESDLLELQTSEGRVISFDEGEDLIGPEASGTMVTEELIERIVKISALRISEEFVREIAEHVVPLVVQEVLSERSSPEANE